MIKEISRLINNINEAGYEYLVKGSMYGIKDTKHYLCTTKADAYKCFNRLYANGYSVTTFDKENKIVPIFSRLPKANNFKNEIAWTNAVMAALQIKKYEDDEREDNDNIKDALTALGFERTVIAFKDLSKQEQENFDDFCYNNLTEDTLIEVNYIKNGEKIILNPNGYANF